MSSKRKIEFSRPPSDRDYSIFERVLVEGRTRQQVAQDVGLSRQRVGSIARQVASWLSKNVIANDPSEVHSTHIRRLEHQWREAMDAWYESRGDEETIKVTIDNVCKEDPSGQQYRTSRERKEKTVRKKPGDIRFLWHARAVMAEIRDLTESGLRFIELGKENVDALDAERDEFRKIVIEAEKLGLLPTNDSPIENPQLPPPKPDA